MNSCQARPFLGFANPAAPAYLTRMGWNSRFDEPIPLPDGGELRTLRAAADHIAALPRDEAEAAHWQLAIENLISAADHGAIVMLARIAVLRALNHDRPVTYRPGPKDPVWKWKWRERRQ
jgi:hypothetical protein